MVSNALPQNSRARGLGIETEFSRPRLGTAAFLPQRIGVIGPVATALNATADLSDQEFTNSQAVGEAYGFGSPMHIASRELFPDDGRESVGSIPVTFHPYADTSVVVNGELDFTAVAAGSQRVEVNVAGEIVVYNAVDDTATEVRDGVLALLQAAINSPFTYTAGAGDEINFIPKASGNQVNELRVTVTTTNVTTAYTAATSAGNTGFPTAAAMLQRVRLSGDRFIVMCPTIEENGASPDALITNFLIALDGEWAPLIHKPVVAVSAESIAQTTMDSLRTYRSGQFCPTSRTDANKSINPDYAVAARWVMRMTTRAEESPARDYGSMRLDGIALPGENLTFDERDTQIKAGYCTVEIKSGVLTISDSVSTQRPENQLDPAYRYIVDIVKLMNITYNIELIFDTEEWDGAPLVPDGQAVTEPSAKSPSQAKGELATMVDNLALAAIISDPATTKAGLEVTIDAQNPKRLNMRIPTLLSGNTNQRAITNDFSFFLGS